MTGFCSGSDIVLCASARVRLRVIERSMPELIDYVREATAEEGSKRPLVDGNTARRRRQQTDIHPIASLIAAFALSSSSAIVSSSS